MEGNSNQNGINIKVEGNSNFKIAISFHLSFVSIAISFHFLLKWVHCVILKTHDVRSLKIGFILMLIN